MEEIKCGYCFSSSVVNLLMTTDPCNLSKGNFGLNKCLTCGMHFTWPQPGASEASCFYGEDYYGQTKKQKDSVFTKTFNKIKDLFYFFRLKRLNLGKSGLRLLDIGCGSGEFLYFAQKNNCDIYGLDVSSAASKIARERYGLNIFNGSIDSAQFTTIFFDIITFWHSFEHLSDAPRVVSKIKTMLKPGGRLLIAVPNIQSIEFGLFKDNWFHLDMPRHLYHYSPLTIKRLLEKEGFLVERISHFSLEYNIAGFLQSTLNKIGLKKNYLYKRFKRGSIEASYVNSLFDITNMLAAILFLPAVFLLSLLFSLVRRGSTITVTARLPG